MYSFFVRPRITQKLIFKEWIRAATELKEVNKVSCYKVGTHFALSRVYKGTPINNNSYRVCQNTLMLLFNYGFFKLNKLKDTIENPSVQQCCKP